MERRISANRAQIVTNSDGGAGYGSERFQETFAQSVYPVLAQLDRYHIA
ncbi:hypothetical protein [Streptohalobacillus salinus]|nr:hypothetical protein [Streptohalobacillus salinus]